MVVDLSGPIYTAAAQYLREKETGIYITGEIGDHPARFPCIQLCETENVPTYMDNADMSDYARIRWRARIFTNQSGSKITQARRILSLLDEVFEPLNLRRTSYVLDNGLYNNSACCLDATYEAVVKSNGYIFRA